MMHQYLLLELLKQPIKTLQSLSHLVLMYLIQMPVILLPLALLLFLQEVSQILELPSHTILLLIFQEQLQLVLHSPMEMEAQFLEQSQLV